MAERQSPVAKFRPVCECGARAPRWLTAWSAAKWMNEHEHAKEAS